MTTIRIRVSEKVLDKFVWLLGRFNSDEIEVIEESEEFIRTRKMLHERAAQLEKGDVKTYSIQEADAILEETIRTYEG